MSAVRRGVRWLLPLSGLLAAAAAGASDLAGPELVPVRAGDVAVQVLAGTFPANSAGVADRLPGGENRAVVVQHGNNHMVSLEQVGEANTATIQQDGSGRKAVIGQYGQGNRADIVQRPQAPAVAVQQRGNQGYARVIQY